MSRRGALLAVLLSVSTGVGCDDARPAGEASDGPPPICSVGVTRCSGDALERCAEDGQRWSREDCRGTLGSNATCVVEGQTARCQVVLCSPTTTRCAEDGLAVERCDAQGQDWKAEERCDPSKGTICLGGRCASPCQALAEKPLEQQRNNVGCTFLPVFLDNNKKENLGIIVSNPNAFAATVKLRDRLGEVARKEVESGGLATLLVPPGVQVLVGSGHGYDLAYELESSLPIAAYQFNPLDKAEQRSNDASLLLPTTALGRRYRVLAGPVTSAGASYVTVVGVEDNTQLTITPSTAIQPQGTLTSALAPGKPYVTTLGARDLFQLASAAKDADLTGTLVESDKPVAVFGGNGCLFLPALSTFCDHIEEQQLPLETWGKRYAAIKFQPRGQQPEDDWWRIIAAEDDTTVTLSGGAGLPTLAPLGAGEHVWVKTAESFVIESDKPVGVGHYMLSQSVVKLPLAPGYDEPFETGEHCAKSATTSSMGDPALSLLVPTKQFRERYIFLVPDTYRYDFVSIAVPAVAGKTPSLRLDGKAISEPLVAVGQTGLSMMTIRVGDGTHRIEGNLPFGIEVHGYDCNVSYAYGGGLKLEVINPID